MSFKIRSKTKKIAFALSLPFVFGGSADAALIEVSSTVTLDTSTQLQWLDLSQSLSYTYNQLVNTELAPGGVFSDYRLATASEIFGFVTDSGILSLSGTPAFTEFANFANVIGASVHDFTGDGCGLIVRGVSAGNAGGDAPLNGFFNMRGPGECATQTPTQSTNGPNSPEILSAAFFNTPLNDFSIQPPQLSGAWLVKDAAAIPIPGTFALVSLGFLALLTAHLGKFR